MATPNLSYQNKFATTLNGGIGASDTTIALVTVPTPTEGYLVIEPDSSTNWEVIYYTSKTGSAVVLPSAAAGRGLGGSTAISHSSGATVRMDSAAELFKTLQDATALTGVHQMNTDNFFDHVASGCVWSGDSYGATLVASMTAGVVYINGRRHTVASITSRAFTLSKDTYVDLLYSTIDNVATPVYTEVANNAASPALAANSVRIAIIVTGASNIANAGSVNQGQETKVLPIASSIPYAVTDSLGNLICPQDPNRKIIGYRQTTSAFPTSSGSDVLITGLTVPVIVPTGRKIKISIVVPYLTNTTAAQIGYVGIFDTSVGGSLLGQSLNWAAQNNYGNPLTANAITTPTSNSKTFVGGMHVSGGTGQINCGAGSPAYIMVELA